MTIGEISLLVGIVGGILAVLGAIFSYIWSANKMAFFGGQFLTKFDHLSTAFLRFEKTFEDHMKEEHIQAQAMWKKMDGHGDKLIEHEQRIGFVEKAIDKK
jgi:hypothetical protein